MQFSNVYNFSHKYYKLLLVYDSGNNNNQLCKGSVADNLSIQQKLIKLHKKKMIYYFYNRSSS